jgi:membrane-associated phospholipid phosphatase
MVRTMAETLSAFLGHDLREALEAGFRRTQAVSPDGGLWLARWALISALIGMTLFMLCGYHAGFARLNLAAARLLDQLWQWLTMLGDERVAFALALFFTRRYPRVFWTLIAAALVGVALTHSLKPLFSALRPPSVLEPGSFHLIGPALHKQSFPSGHTVTATIFFGAWVYFLRAQWWRLLLILVAIAVGLSRVALGVHWPVDVAAGLAVGSTALWLGMRLAAGGEALGKEPRVHLALVALAAGMAASLLLWDGGYPGARDMQVILAVAALAYAAFTYLAGPILRRSTSRA